MATATAELAVTRVDDIVSVTLDRPHAHNALTWAMYDALEAACAAVRADPTVRGVLLRGAGGRALAAGTDIAQFSAIRNGADGVAYEARLERVLRAFLDLDVPTAAIVDGYAVGAGLLLAAACDVRVCTTDARFGVPIAQTLGNAVSQFAYDLLADRLGPARTLAALVTAELVAPAALAGFVHRVVGRSELDDEVARLAESFAAAAPLTVRAAKRADRVRRGADPESDLVAEAYGSTDFAAAVDAFVRRAPHPPWTGR